MLEQGHPAANIRAVAGLVDSPVRAEQTLDHLAALLSTEDFQELEAAVQRIRRIIPAGATPGYDPGLFDSPAEEGLATALEKARAGLRGETDLRRFAAEAAVVVHPVTVFFDEVLVMADDPAVRANRLGLLAAVHDLADGYLDWKELS